MLLALSPVYVFPVYFEEVALLEHTNKEPGAFGVILSKLKTVVNVKFSSEEGTGRKNDGNCRRYHISLKLEKKICEPATEGPSNRATELLQRY